MDRYRIIPGYRFYDIEGNSPLTLDKSVGKPLRDYKIYGSCGDKTKNLLDYTQINNSAGYNDITQIENGFQLTGYGCPTNITPEMFLEMTGLKIGDTPKYIANHEIINGRFTLYDFWKGSLYFPLRSDANKGYQVRNNYASQPVIPENFNSETYDTMRIYGALNASDGSAPLVYVTNMFLCKDGDTIEYEPYGYKIPIKVSGENLFDTTNIYLDEPLTDGEYIDYINQKVVKTNGEMSVNLPTIKTDKGTNVISVESKLQPSNMKVQYYK